MAIALPSNMRDILAQLTKKLGIDLADLDYTEQAKRRGHENNVQNMALSRIGRLKNSAISMADRGLSQSGIALNQATELNKASDQELGAASQNLSSELSSIARKRIQAQSEYALKKAELERNAIAATAPETFVPTPPAGKPKAKAPTNTSGGTPPPRRPAGYVEPTPTKRTALAGPR